MAQVRQDDRTALFDAFLKLDNVKGESQDSKHKDEIDILEWNWTVENQGTGHYGGGLGAGKVKVGDLNFKKRADASTPVLLKSCTTGDHIGNGVLTVRKAGGSNPLEYYKVTFTDLFVSSIEMFTDPNEPVLHENVSLNFSSFKVEYTQQSQTGGAGKTGDFGWHLGQMKKL